MLRSPAFGRVLCALAVLLTAAAFLGLSTRRARLNLGPGDTPFVSGFQADSDVEDKVGWHWTTYTSAASLPLTTAGAELAVTLRYARIFGEEAVVNVRVGNVAVEPFRARGPEVKTTELVAAGVQGPIRVAMSVDSHERRDMGLRMDSILVDVRSGAPLKLAATAALRPAVTVLLLAIGMMLLGATPLASGLCSLIAGSTLSAVASGDLFAAWRLTDLAPQMLIVSTLVLLAGKAGLKRAGMEDRPAAWLASAALATMLLRVTLVSQPDFYYPDLLTHTRVAEAIRQEGPSFFLHPAETLAEQRAWTKPVLGGVSSLPYAVMFHAPFALLAGLFGLNRDQIETAMKAVSCLISVLPILLTAAIASRLSLPPLAALGLCLIPAYVSRLSFALLPALFGHVFDLMALLAVATFVAADSVGRSALRLPTLVALFLVLGHLAYTSSVVNEGLFMAILIGLIATAGRDSWRTAGVLFVAEALAAFLAFALYYRDFVGDVSGLVSRVLGVSATSGSGGASVYPIESFWALLWERSTTFFSPFILASVVGLLMAGRGVFRSRVLQAWVLTYLALILLRAKVPDIFRYGHETLFLTPLVAATAATALILLWRRGGVWRAAACLWGAALTVVAIDLQVRAVADQLRNAL